MAERIGLKIRDNRIYRVIVQEMKKNLLDKNRVIIDVGMELADSVPSKDLKTPTYIQGRERVYQAEKILLMEPKWYATTLKNMISLWYPQYRQYDQWFRVF